MDVAEAFNNGIIEGAKFILPIMLKGLAPYIIIILFMYAIAAVIKRNRKKHR